MLEFWHSREMFEVHLTLAVSLLCQITLEVIVEPWGDVHVAEVAKPSTWRSHSPLVVKFDTAPLHIFQLQPTEMTPPQRHEMVRYMYVAIMCACN